MNKKQTKSMMTKKKIAEAAKHLFIQKGYASTSIENISEATGVSKGNIYYHFENKEGLFIYVLDEWEKEWMEQWEEQKKQYSSATEQLHGIAKHFVINDYNHPLTDVADEFFSHEKSNTLVQNQLYKTINTRISYSQNLLSEGIASGEFKSDNALLLAKIFDTLLYGLNNTCRDLDMKQTLDLYAKAIDTFLYGIASVDSNH
ncbi:TetR/AcrR family transcriptional regulator [Oceanobacillus jeddahense]|uniref:TetR/AcrR family transcriptional regulator n=1 Tax=Oceanobacillus jeddahense TaxID=1462527 RepID=A0ABY5JLJ0_9BACI|nr:TetR/AcrR family transcriptional regulator [Oceanobacillus jeddahense]UUI01170.1 TetR/AcrR family transcriptional regulator [Oceanobacillus jeddahense]